MHSDASFTMLKENSFAKPICLWLVNPIEFIIDLHRFWYPEFELIHYDKGKFPHRAYLHLVNPIESIIEVHGFWYEDKYPNHRQCAGYSYTDITFTLPMQQISTTFF